MTSDLSVANVLHLELPSNSPSKLVLSLSRDDSTSSGYSYSTGLSPTPTLVHSRSSNYSSSGSESLTDDEDDLGWVSPSSSEKKLALPIIRGLELSVSLGEGRTVSRSLSDGSDDDRYLELPSKSFVKTLPLTNHSDDLSPTHDALSLAIRPNTPSIVIHPVPSTLSEETEQDETPTRTTPLFPLLLLDDARDQPTESCDASTGTSLLSSPDDLSFDVSTPPPAPAIEPEPSYRPISISKTLPLRSLEDLSRAGLCSLRLSRPLPSTSPSSADLEKEEEEAHFDLGFGGFSSPPLAQSPARRSAPLPTALELELDAHPTSCTSPLVGTGPARSSLMIPRSKQACHLALALDPKSRRIRLQTTIATRRLGSVPASPSAPNRDRDRIPPKLVGSRYLAFLLPPRVASNSITESQHGVEKVGDHLAASQRRDSVQELPARDSSCQAREERRGRAAGKLLLQLDVIQEEE